MIFIRSRLSGFPCVVCLLWLMSSTHVLAESLDTLIKVPVPPGTQLGIVSVGSVHNGASVSTATYHSTLSLDDTLAFYENVWPHESNSKIPGRLESVVGDWLLISRIRDDVNTVIQLKVSETYRSTGFLSVMAINSSDLGTRKNDKQGNYQELSKTVSKDGALSSTFSVLESKQSMSTFIQSLVRLRTDAGWRLSSQKKYEGSQNLLMNRQSQRLEMVVSQDRQGGVLAVVNEVHHANE